MNSLKDHIYSFDTIVVGGNLSSLIYAYINKLPIIISKVDSPHSIDFFESNISLKQIKLNNEYKVLATPESTLTIGLSKENVYTNLYYTLAMNGQIIFDVPSQSVRLFREQNLIKIVSDRSRLFSFRYENLISFTRNIVGLEMEVNLLQYELLGLFDVRRCYLHVYQALSEQEKGIIRFGLFEDYKTLLTSTLVDKETFEKNHHLDFYIKSYLEKYLSTFLIQRGRHKIKVDGKKIIKREIYEENIIRDGNISLMTLSEESIINGKNN